MKPRRARRASPGGKPAAFAFVLLALAGGAQGLAAGPAEGGNAYCPVQPTEPASSRHVVVHQGRRVLLCCEECMAQFKAKPQAYLPNLSASATALAASAPQHGHVHGSGYLEWKSAQDAAPSGEARPSGGATLALLWAFSDAVDDLRAPAAVLLLVLVVVLARRLRRRHRMEDVRQALRRLRAELRRPLVRFTAAQFLAILALFYLYQVTAWKAESYQHLFHSTKDELYAERVHETVHYATFYDFGIPPVPVKPPLPPQLSATFYRGNDERDPQLFNGGHYRTATFHVSLRGSNGPVGTGGQFAGQPLSVRLEIARAPHTPDFFWQPDRMDRMFLTRLSDPFLGDKKPVPDRQGLTVLEPLRRWEALYPLDPVPPTGEARQAGIVYVCEQQVGGARFHYAIQYDLHFRDGRAGPKSDLWMGALYRTRRVTPANLPLSEWFSHNPIPVLPRMQIQDPRLLGTQDDSAPQVVENSGR